MSDFSHKFAKPDHPIMDEIAQRWSPYLFDASRSVDPDKLKSCLEAARWSASSFNEQPWRFMLATREDPQLFQTALECLVEANQVWAQHAAVLILTAYATKFSRNGKDNRVAFHDLGLAAASLSLEAVRQGLQVHQMAGVNLSKVRATYGVPSDFEPATAIAIGHARHQSQSDDSQLASRDAGDRQRKPLSEWVFGQRWESPSTIV